MNMIYIDLKDDLSEKMVYDYPDCPAYTIHEMLSHYPNYSAISHWHDDIEFLMIQSGQMQYNVNGKILTLEQGQGIFVNSRQMHYGFSESHRDCEFFCILIHPMLLCTLPAYEKNFVLPLIRNNEVPFFIFDPGISWQAQILKQMADIYVHRKSKTAPLRILSSFSLIWALLLEHLPSASRTEDHTNTDLTTIRNMTGFIQQNYASRISLKEIAAAGSVGISKCCKLFSRYFSQSPNLYLNQYRLNKSALLLRETDMTITEIALSTGFGSASYYAGSFRKWAGMSPGEFRKAR